MMPLSVQIIFVVFDHEVYVRAYETGYADGYRRGFTMGPKWIKQ